jgi:GNAT superfamily N-acetyltransferase
LTLTPVRQSGDWQYRPGLKEDARECVRVRGLTRQNAGSEERLRSFGITEASWGENIRSGALPRHVCAARGKLVGFCFGLRDTGEIQVLAVLPEYEGFGIGRELLRRTCFDLAVLGHKRLFLGCSPDPESRSHGFYRHLGWRSTGKTDAHGDEILETFVVHPASPD